MSFIPEEEIKGKVGVNLAPMIDFLFLMLMFFASIAVSRVMTKDTSIDLVEIKPESKSSLILSDLTQMKIIQLTIDASGQYAWVTDIKDYPLFSSEQIAEELNQQHSQGLLPEDKSKTQVMLKIDKKAPWDPILRALFAIREAGFEAHPVYTPEETPS